MNADANKPRLVMVEGNRSTVFLHPCSVCGAAGLFGEGVRILQGKPGTWFCAEHWPSRTKSSRSQQKDLF